MQRVVAHTENTKPEIAFYLAKSYEAALINTEAYRYYFKCRDIDSIVRCLEQIMAEGYPSEYDMFYAKATLDLILRVTDLKQAEHILAKGVAKCGSTPLLDFLEFFIHCLRAQNFNMVKQMVSDYSAVLNRDPIYEQKIDKIC